MCIGRFFGADGGDRTRDLRVTNALLYQLSYIGMIMEQIIPVPMMKRQYVL